MIETKGITESLCTKFYPTIFKLIKTSLFSKNQKLAISNQAIFSKCRIGFRSGLVISRIKIK
jgi:hypothetical protein